MLFRGLPRNCLDDGCRDGGLPQARVDAILSPQTHCEGEWQL
jgi:hypothetical protein